jgi:hypothetical protein
MVVLSPAGGAKTKGRSSDLLFVLDLHVELETPITYT